MCFCLPEYAILVMVHIVGHAIELIFKLKIVGSISVDAH